LEELPLGGTAVGTGINTHPKFARNVIERLSLETGFQLREAMNHFESQGARDACVMASGVLKTIAISLIKIACDIRLLGSGPRLGLGELRIPPTQPGSSIMPGKVNPVICEMVVQVGAQVIGNDAAIAWGGAFGNLELNTMMPLIAYNLLESIELLSNAATQFSRRCISGLEADELHCRTGIERSLALATLLVPAIGYDQAASIAKKAYENNRSVREVALEMAGLAREALESLLGKTGSNETPGSSPISK
jgi:fumarate hydratase class II